MYGAAGVGKSAIAQTIAELCHARHLVLANFFFFLLERIQRKISHCQCRISNLPQAEDAIEAAVDRDLGIF